MHYCHTHSESFAVSPEHFVQDFTQNILQ